MDIIFTGHLEWEVHHISGLVDRKFSDNFKVGIYSWRLICFPRGNMKPFNHVSLFLEYPETANTPAELAPVAEFRFIVRNHKDPSKNVVKECRHTFTSEQVDWGFSQVLPLQDLTAASGFLREDGTLTVRVEVTVEPAGLKKLDLYTLKAMAKWRDSVKAGQPAANTAPAAMPNLLRYLSPPPPGAVSTTDMGGDGAAGSSSSNNSSAVSNSVGGMLAIRIADKTFYAHRALLEDSSEYFRLQSNFNGSDTGSTAAAEVSLPDADPDAFARLLVYMYQGVLDIPASLLRTTTELAGRLLMSDVCKELQRRLLAACTPQSIVGDLLWADRYQLHELLSGLKSYFVQNYKRIAAEARVDELILGNPVLTAELMRMLGQQMA
ncbi:hypothetical protein Agub_g4948 [Astrephomene gubernaculifera]|uniref:Uncharacterized protein n=1 Tax=Astrephomene gubernaculifera TaxID=47775 RepID=A0AAD3DLI8_9CHLO|nr:hypothetical protein Agub_g4948 [Astrephomene gubernaculifera]